MCNNVFPSSSHGFNAHSFCSIHDTLAFLLFPQSSSLVRNCKSWSIFPNNFVSSFPLSTVLFSFSFTNAVIAWSSTSATSAWLGRFLLSLNTVPKKYDKHSMSMLTCWLQHCAIFIAWVHSPTHRSYQLSSPNWRSFIVKLRIVSRTSRLFSPRILSSIIKHSNVRASMSLSIWTSSPRVWHSILFWYALTGCKGCFNMGSEVFWNRSSIPRFMYWKAALSSGTVPIRNREAPRSSRASILCSLEHSGRLIKSSTNEILQWLLARRRGVKRLLLYSWHAPKDKSEWTATEELPRIA